MSRILLRLMTGVLVGVVLCLTSCSRPDFQLSSGESGRFSDWRGKWVLINYWAVWCEPCRQEIPEFNAFYADHKNEILVVGVNYDAAINEELKKQVEKMAITFPVLTKDPAKALGLDNADVLPMTYVINPEGKLVRRLLGPQTKASLGAAINTKAHE